MWFKWIDQIINKLTMYRLLMYYLIGLLLVAIGFSSVGIIHLSAIDIIISSVLLVTACYVINKVFSYIFSTPVNPESSIITGLILALIMPPNPTGYGLLFVLAAAGLGMASKYFITYRNKHIFNPAAVAVFLTAIGPHQSADWWVATGSLFPFILLGGLLIIRKVRRESMLVSFLLASTIATALFSIQGGSSLSLNLKNMLLSSGLLFLGFVMLTEPFTSPDTKVKRIIYGAMVGIIMAPQFHVGHYYSTPEAALLIGNLFAFIVSSKGSLMPVLRQKYRITKDSAEFVYAPERALSYLPGQYMEFTLPHTKMDSRGARRYFTLSSSPTEANLSIGVRFYDESSSYKIALADSERGDMIAASRLEGDFTMPSDKSKKLLFVAGGIGITPFRSMIKYLIDTREKRDVVLVYAARSADQIAYKEVFEQAEARFGLRVHYVLSNGGNNSGLKGAVKGRLSGRGLKRLVPDINSRKIYISGPPNLIEDLKQSLVDNGVSRANIKVDFFSGYS